MAGNAHLLVIGTLEKQRFSDNRMSIIKQLDHLTCLEVGHHAFGPITVHLLTTSATTTRWPRLTKEKKFSLVLVSSSSVYSIALSSSIKIILVLHSFCYDVIDCLLILILLCIRGAGDASDL